MYNLNSLRVYSNSDDNNHSFENDYNRAVNTLKKINGGGFVSTPDGSVMHLGKKKCKKAELDFFSTVNNPKITDKFKLRQRLRNKLIE